MDTLKQLQTELTEEYNTTKKFISEFPEGKNDYTPHPKSMKLMHLAQHITEVFGWASFMLKTEFLDLAEGDKPALFESREQLMEALEKNYNDSLAALQSATEADLEPIWSLNYNGNKLAEWTKYAAIRHSLNQITHHRAQLGVYYRLNDVKVPGSYGPSADEQNF
ncbi:DinB family protein [Niabella insulamsoli]|uniref:DinB family protein n=1 Tax=Niabella insulamsoli TaxID=3144874 RepID=UPI0031FC177D